MAPRNRSVLWLSVAALVAAVRPAPPATQQPSPRVEELLDQLTREPGRTVERLAIDRDALVDRLVPLLEPVDADGRKRDPALRQAAAYLLGELRAHQAVRALARALPDNPGRRDPFMMDRYDSVYWNALVRIGRPSIPAMVQGKRT